uniref:Globin domain-containing protein n=1 Tax=Maylandia zebra TaxID=106582 RepID=A0A3P9D5Z6_9CICH
MSRHESLERTKPWSFWDKATPKAPEIGAEALGRMLTAYPQTKTYCSHWARFCTGEDARRQHHGVGNIDDLVGDLTNLSKLCFQILAHNIILCMAMFSQEDFTPEVHVSFDMFLQNLSLALSDRYR